MTCIFCEIIAKRIPAEIVFENETVFAFLDIHPVNPGHTLVVPKEHHESVMAISDTAMGALATELPRLALAVVKAVSAEGCNLNSNNGAAAGQVVSHLHFHIIPRFLNDGYKPWGHKEYKAGEAIATAEAIRKALI